MNDDDDDDDDDDDLNTILGLITLIIQIELNSGFKYHLLLPSCFIVYNLNTTIFPHHFVHLPVLHSFSSFVPKSIQAASHKSEKKFSSLIALV
jgi:hypothetical protein